MSRLPILIIGGGGKTGARVNMALNARGVATRPVSRSTAVPFDWSFTRADLDALLHRLGDHHDLPMSA